MGLYESMRSWRWCRSAGVGVLLLWLSLAQSVSAQGVCPASKAPTNLTQPVYQDETSTNVGFMTDLVQSFLGTVQPNPLPTDLILRIVNETKNPDSDKEIFLDSALYEVGFLVCTAIGILYFLLMPIVGLFLACCRCCGNCGGKMYQKQTPSIHCRRRTIYWSTFSTTVIILAGNICMFISNNAINTSTDLIFTELNTTVDNVKIFLNSVPQQISYVERKSYETIDEIDSNLHGIGLQLGTNIQQRLGEVLNPVLQSVELLDNETVSINGQINKLNSSLAELQSSTNLLQANLTVVKDDIDQTLSKPSCIGCGALKPEIPDLTLDTSIFIQNLNDLQSAVNEVNEANVSSKIQKVKEEYLNSIPETVTNKSNDLVEKGSEQLYDIKVQIQQAIKDFPAQDLTSVSDTLDQVKEELTVLTPTFEFVESIRWKVFLVLCCLVLLVVVCNLLGLLLGPAGLKSRADPTKRSCTADCGGVFFMMGAGFSFLFSWLLMLVVLGLFLAGGNIYTLLCKPWNNGQLLKLIDTPGLIPELNISSSLGVNTDITVSDVYNDCAKNETLWTTFHLNEVINLDELLNVSKIQQNLVSPNITLPTVTLLNEDVKKQLSSFSSKAKEFNSTSITQQINHISSINLTKAADMLDKLAANQLITNNDTRQELQNEAMNLRRIQSAIETTITPQLESLNSTIKNLESTVEEINGTVGEVLRDVNATQDFLDTNTSQIVENESQKFLDCHVDFFTLYADWAKHTITEQVGRCGPVAGGLDSVELLFCSNFVESLNAFWFSFGWCLIFFIPSIILSMKLAKYYRRMKHSDVYEDHIIMNHIPRAQGKFT